MLCEAVSKGLSRACREIHGTLLGPLRVTLARADGRNSHVVQVAAFLPAKGKFVPDEEEELSRPKGALQDPSISLANPKKVLRGLAPTLVLATLWWPGSA